MHLQSAVLATALLTLASTAYNANVPFLPIEISKLGNHGLAYWCFSIGGTTTATLLLLLNIKRDTICFSSVASCLCLTWLTIFSDAGWPKLHLFGALGFFLSSICFAVTQSGWADRFVCGAIVCYSIRNLLLPLQVFGDAIFWQRIRAAFQWATVAFLIARGA